MSAFSEWAYVQGGGQIYRIEVGLKQAKTNTQFHSYDKPNMNDQALINFFQKNTFFYVV